MLTPHWFLPYDSILQFITTLLALAVSMFAYRGYRWIQDRTFKALYISFALLATGFFIKGLVLAFTFAYGVNYAEHGTLVDVLALGFWIYYILTIIAFGTLVYVYSGRLSKNSMALAAVTGTTLLLVNPFFELVIVVLLLIIIMAQLAHIAVRRSVNAEVVTFGFTALLIGHILFMLGAANDLLYVFGTIFQLIAFASLILVLHRLREPK
jgi:hypothetical protein